MDRFQWFQLFAQLGVVHRICRLVVSRRGCPASKTGYAGGKIQMGQHFGAGRFEKWDPINLTNQFLAPYNYLVSSITHNFMYFKNVIFYLRTLCHRFKLLFDFIYPQKSGYKLFNHTLFDKVDVLNCLKISLVL